MKVQRLASHVDSNQVAQAPQARRLSPTLELSSTGTKDTVCYDMPSRSAAKAGPSTEEKILVHATLMSDTLLPSQGPGCACCGPSAC